MSSFPNFSNIAQHVQDELTSRKGNIMKVSNLNAWVRVASGVGSGCQLISNPNFSLFGGAGSIYGNDTMSGTLGYTWDGKGLVTADDFHGYRPKPNITSIEVDEGAGNISRKATFSITCYTRAQLDTMCKYFLEPGYTIFLEWGWNTPSGVSQFTPTLSGDSVGANQSFQTVNTTATKVDTVNASAKVNNPGESKTTSAAIGTDAKTVEQAKGGTKIEEGAKPKTPPPADDPVKGKFAKTYVTQNSSVLFIYTTPAPEKYPGQWIATSYLKGQKVLSGNRQSTQEAAVTNLEKDWLSGI